MQINTVPVLIAQIAMSEEGNFSELARAPGHAWPVLRPLGEN